MQLKRYSSPILLSISSLLYALSFSDYQLWYCAYISVVPLLMVLENKNQRSGFVAGLAFGTISSVLMLYWVTVAMSVYGGIHWFFSALLLLILGMILGLIFFAPMTYLISYLNTKKIHPLITVPPIWVAFEYLKTYLFTGFPWNLTGYSQLPFLKIIQIADITGVYGVSFLVIFINTGIYMFLKNFIVHRRVSIKEALIVLIAFFLTVVYGSYQENRWNELIKAGQQFNFGLIQGNINQDQKWDQAYQDETMRIYTELTIRSFNNGAEVVVWPETATPFYFQSASRYREQILDLAKQYRKWLIFGSPAYTYKNKKMWLYNSAYSVSPSGFVSDRYDKMHLVPFGEYVPLKSLLFFVDKLVPAAGDFSAGEEMVLLNVNNFKIGMSICYEIIFPGHVRRSVKKGADLLVTITNDAWFGRTVAPGQHFRMAAFRAVENRRPLLRAANTGITGYVDQTGRVIAKTQIFTTAWLNGTVNIVKEMSFYSKYGDVFSIFMCLWSILILAVGYLRKQ